ncbi:MAG: Serine/threonine-protein kinase PknJ [Firmicutes bacterium ADurb.Bin300]|nr:MAG: Serine/threonine-protein kinase PknJ [Firmicutes bacterium ADurb.Bin300]
MIGSIDKYHVIKELGSGQFGTVYKVFDMTLKAERAIKVLHCDDKEDIAKHFKEAEIPYKCGHKNIVLVKSADIKNLAGDVNVIIDMEYINGGSIQDLINTSFVSVQKAIKYVSESLFGLEFAHNNGIIHRDIKPANIMLMNDVPKISDFGLSVPTKTVLKNDALYIPHTPCEVFDTGKVDIQTDIFAMGMTLYRIVNNVRDWTKIRNNIQNYSVHIEKGTLIDKLPFMPHIPRAVKRIIKKACDKDSSKRYNTSVEFRNALEKLNPHIDWEKNDEGHWKGIGFQDTKKYTLLLEKKLKGCKFILKINNRTVHAESKGFSNEEEAQKYLMEYISKTTFK